MHTHELPEIAGTGADEIRLMTIRSEGQFNTVVYEDEDVYRGIDRHNVILLHPDDLARFNLKDGDRVSIHGPAGSMHGIRATAFVPVRAGNAAMYYPECNVLVSRHLDPQSRTPAFKCVIVRVEHTPAASMPGSTNATHATGSTEHEIAAIGYLDELGAARNRDLLGRNVVAPGVLARAEPLGAIHPLVPRDRLAGVRTHAAHEGDHRAVAHVVAVVDRLALADAGEQLVVLDVDTCWPGFSGRCTATIVSPSISNLQDLGLPFVPSTTSSTIVLYRFAAGR